MKIQPHNKTPASSCNNLGFTETHILRHRRASEHTVDAKGIQLLKERNREQAGEEGIAPLSQQPLCPGAP